jgi:6-pyruvoyltetrahydropterin/6-carboxytetrahydropterin synthase
MNCKNISVTKEFSFDAAHLLENYHGKCEALHGHTWRVQVTAAGPMNPEGIVLDFTDMKRIIDQHVRNKLDHSYLNNFISQPTAENIGLWIHEQLSSHLPGITEIKVFESPTSFATLSF